MLKNTMHMKRFKCRTEFAGVLLGLLSIVPMGWCDDSYDDGVIPRAPVPFPKKYEDYQILPGSISPDKKLAFIYPKRNALSQIDKVQLLAVALKPFRVLREIPLDENMTFASNGHGYYEVHWARDSSAATFVEGAKWGPDEVYLFSLDHGKANKPVNLTAEVRKLIRRTF